jgi:hypothetical protein
MRKRMDNFKALLRHLTPPILPTDKWSEVRSRVSRSDEYAELDEEQRDEVFVRVIQRLLVIQGVFND